jgi:hypothetical protein
MVEAFEEQRFFCLTLIAQYCGSSIVGNDYFWHAKDVSLLEEALVFISEEGIQPKGFSNLHKRRGVKV